MTYRYEWRAMSYAFFMHEDYPPFDFDLSSEDDGMEPHTSLRLIYPEHLERWKPLYKWLLAIPQYFVLAALFVAACVGVSSACLPCSSPGSTREGSGTSSSVPTATHSASRPTSASSLIDTRRSASPLEAGADVTIVHCTKCAPERSCSGAHLAVYCQGAGVALNCRRAGFHATRRGNTRACTWWVWGS